MSERSKKRKAADAFVSGESELIDAKRSNNSNDKQIVKFLIKSEPYEYGIENLMNEVDGIGRYDAVRNYQARNHIKLMKPGDRIYFYHSNIGKLSGIYGVVEISGEIFPDPTACDPEHKHFDALCKPTQLATDAKWVAFNMKLVEKWDKPILLSELKGIVKSEEGCPLKEMMLFKNSRLSVQIVKEIEARFIDQLRESKAS